MALATLCCALAAFLAEADAAVTTGPSYVQVPGSPFQVGTALDSIAASPSGSILAAADYGGGGVDVLAVNSTTGSLTAAAGSPFTSGHGADSVAFSPGGSLIAAANLVDNTVSVFTVSAAGALNRVGSPVSTGISPRAVAFNPAGNLLAVANASGNTVSIFTVDPSTGVLTPSADSPLQVGDGPAAVAFNPGGSLLAVADSLSSTISVFSTGAAAADFFQVPGSPFATGGEPLSVAFNSDGSLLATADFLDGTVGLFTVGANGALTLEQGSPFPGGSGPRSVAFVPKSALIAVSSGTGGTVSMLEPMPPPTVSITVPASGGSYILGQRVQTRFSCTDSAEGPGIASCKDGSGAKEPTGLLNTKHLGRHTYTVTALSADGLTATSTVAYEVAPLPPVSVSPPRLAGVPSVGHTVRCSQGTWRREPTSYSYQWARGGIPLYGADRASYRVAKLDEGSQLTCSVTAHNGSNALARSSSVHVALEATRGCPAPSGKLAGARLGAVRLAATKRQLAAALSGVEHTSSKGTEQFCLDPAGITVGFPDRALNSLLRITPLSGRVVWALTANPLYSYDGIRPGMELAAAEHRLGAGKTAEEGKTVYYLVRGQTSTMILVAKDQLVQQIGIADNHATASPALRAALIGTLPS